MGTCWNGFSSKVTIVDIANSLCSGTLDHQTEITIQMQLRKRKIQFMLGVKITSVRRKGDKANVKIKNGHNEKDYEYDKILIVIGDIIQGPQLAHKASTEGVLCVERITSPNI